MNTLLKKLLFMGLVIAFFASCKKDESRDYFQGGTAPVLAATLTDSIPLAFANASQDAISFSWTNPNYKFASGISSQDVSYLLEIDTMGANFTNPKRIAITVSKDLSFTITQSALNSYLLNQLLLDTGMSHTIQARITANITGVSATAVASNVLSYKVTPYAIPPAVAPPSSGTLYITGSATAKGWMSGGDAPVSSQQFTKISTTLYQISIPLIGGQSYTFVPVYGDWSNKYSIATKNDPNEINGGDFQVGGNDILAPSLSATYLIVVNFQTGKFSVTQQ
jgi:starch-binding outer membrane protein SusE/F